MQSLCFLLVFLLLLLVLLLCFNIFCRSFAFSTNLTFVLLWSVLVNLLRPSPPPGSLHLTAPLLGVYVLEFFHGPFCVPPIVFPLPHLVGVCVRARGYWWVGCATHFLTFRWGKCVFMHWLAGEWQLESGSGCGCGSGAFGCHLLVCPSMSLFALVGVHFPRACHLMWL